MEIFNRWLLIGHIYVSRKLYLAFTATRNIRDNNDINNE